VADESDDRAGEREVLTNLPRTRPARRSTRRASAPAQPEAAPETAPETAPARKPAAKRSAAKRTPAKAAASSAKPKRAPANPAAARRRAAPKPAEPETVVVPTRAAPPLPPQREPHRSPLADLAVTSIELTGELFQLGIDVTRSIVRATIGRFPRP
jgi:hypothetical protein